MTDSIKISLDTEGIDELLRVNDELMETNARLEREISTRDDNKLFTACLAVGSVLVNLALLYYIALHAVTVHGIFHGVTR